MIISLHQSTSKSLSFIDYRLSAAELSLYTISCFLMSTQKSGRDSYIVLVVIQVILIVSPYFASSRRIRGFLSETTTFFPVFASRTSDADDGKINIHILRQPFPFLQSLICFARSCSQKIFIILVVSSCITYTQNEHGYLHRRYYICFTFLEKLKG